MENKKILEEFRKKWTEKTEDGFGAFYKMTSGGNPFYDLTRIEKWLEQALQQKDQELIEKIVNYDEQYISEDVRKAINRMKDKLTDLIKNQ